VDQNGSTDVDFGLNVYRKYIKTYEQWVVIYMTQAICNTIWAMDLIMRQGIMRYKK